ncbi:MAG: APC family permease [Actinomycetaceae bacterium]|nr:APC family permease [Actinomycetaceae bacterium]
MHEFLDRLRQILVGRPMSTEAMGRTLLPKRIALPVFASDALSSVAYAPDEILLTLSLAGLSALTLSPWVGLGVVAVLAVVVLSYRQTVYAYPSGGGDYEVVSTNFGPRAGLVVASALMVDYALTVAVSVSSGAHYLSTAVPYFVGKEAIVGVTVVAILVVMNLRGMRESGRAFAVPVYLYMVSIFLMVAFGLFQHMNGTLAKAPSAIYEVVPTAQHAGGLLGVVGFFLVLRSFSSGCAALTGVEAISNGVPAFKKPKSKNAATTLALLGLISAAMMMSILHLASATGLRFVEDPATQLALDGKPVGEGVRLAPVIGQLAATIFANVPPLFYLVTVVTGLILVLAANTAFNGFPQLASVLARDSFLPRQLKNRGDRLSYSNGIVILGLVASGIMVAFNAEVTKLIQLYVVGVFVAFTFSQLGMLRHWNRNLTLETSLQARRHMRRSRLINAIGLAMTSCVLLVVLVTKFTHGAWITVLLMSMLYLAMMSIRKHYEGTERELQIDSFREARSLPSRVHALVLVSALHKPAMKAIAYARATNPASLEIVHISVDPAETARLRKDWEASGLDIPLTVVASPFREITRPAAQYARSVRRRSPHDLVAVFIPEYLVSRWWHQLLHNHTALRLKTRLLFEKGLVMASVPYQLHKEVRPKEPSKDQWATGWKDRDDA